MHKTIALRHAMKHLNEGNTVSRDKDGLYKVVVQDHRDLHTARLILFASGMDWVTGQRDVEVVGGRWNYSWAIYATDSSEPEAV